MHKTYRVFFIDATDSFGNQKLFEANSIEDVRDYMQSLGHEILKIEDVLS